MRHRIQEPRGRERERERESGREREGGRKREREREKGREGVHLPEHHLRREFRSRCGVLLQGYLARKKQAPP